MSAQEATDWREYTAWEPVIADGASVTATGENGQADYAAFIGDLFGCELDIIRDGNVVATITETLSVVFFPLQTGDWSFEVRNGTGSEQTPILSQVQTGVAVDIPVQELGFNAPTLSRDTDLITNISEEGTMLGRSVKRTANVFTIRARLMDADYAHSLWYSVIRHAENKPFWFYQDIGFREDVAFCWLDKNLSKPSYSNYKRIDHAMQVRGHVREDLSTAPTVTPAFRITDSSAIERDSQIQFVVTRSGDTTNTATVDFDTADGSAVAGTDYTETSGALTFLAGVSQLSFFVPIADDTEINGARSFTVSLSNATIDIARATAFGTIIDDDDIDSPIMYAGNAEGFEGSALVFTISKQGGYDQTSRVNYATADQTAVAGTHYQGVAGQVTFLPGETAKTVSVVTNDDFVYNGDRSLRLVLSNPINAALGGNGTGIIRDNEDPAPPIDDQQVFFGVSQDPSKTETAGLSSDTDTDFKQVRTFDASPNGGNNYIYFAWPIEFGSNPTFKVSGFPTTFGHDAGGGFVFGTPAQAGGLYYWRSEYPQNGTSISVEVE